MKIIETPIRCQTLIKKEAATIYELLTTAQGWDSWFTTGQLLI